jgi:N utilization substance protein A
MAMGFEIIQALKQIAREKDVDEALIIETLVAGLVSAARKKYGQESNIVVEVDQEAGNIAVYRVRSVVQKVENEETEVSVEEAREYEPDIKPDEELRVEIPLVDFGRNAIQAAKQVVIQRVREAERERIFGEFEDRIGEIVTGGVQQIDRGNIIVNLGRTEAILLQREQIPREQFRQGNSIKAYIVDVSKTSKGPPVMLSRNNPEFLRKLFELEVPEIKEGIVEIKAVARDPGSRSKIAVHSNDDKVDAVGACVGMKGSRVQSVVRELGGERIDVVLWSDDPIEFVTRALSPAQVVLAQMDDGENKVTVVVADDQLSLAIGRGGQNARLAARLTNLKIDLINESQYAERLEFQERPTVALADVDGIGAKTRERLEAAGYKTADEVAEAALEDLTAISGIGAKMAGRIVAAAREALGEDEAAGAAVEVEEEPEALEAEEELETLETEEEPEALEAGEELETLETEEEPEGAAETEEEPEALEAEEEPETLETEEEPEGAAETEGEPEALEAEEESETLEVEEEPEGAAEIEEEPEAAVEAGERAEVMEPRKEDASPAQEVGAANPVEAAGQRSAQPEAETAGDAGAAQDVERPEAQPPEEGSVESVEEVEEESPDREKDEEGGSGERAV